MAGESRHAHYGQHWGEGAARYFSIEGDFLNEDQAVRLMPVPDSFMCPISAGIMNDPVATVDGCAYERGSIERWFRERRQEGHQITSPITGLELPSATLMPLVALQRAIEAYLVHRPELKQAHMAGRSFEEAAQILQTDLFEKQAMHSTAQEEIRRLREANRTLRRLLREAEDRLHAAGAGPLLRADDGTNSVPTTARSSASFASGISSASGAAASSAATADWLRSSVNEAAPNPSAALPSATPASSSSSVSAPVIGRRCVAAGRERPSEASWPEQRAIPAASIAASPLITEGMDVASTDVSRAVSCASDCAVAPGVLADAAEGASKGVCGSKSTLDNEVSGGAQKEVVQKRRIKESRCCRDLAALFSVATVAMIALMQLTARTPELPGQDDVAIVDVPLDVVTSAATAATFGGDGSLAMLGATSQLSVTAVSQGATPGGERHYSGSFVAHPSSPHTSASPAFAQAKPAAAVDSADTADQRSQQVPLGPESHLFATEVEKLWSGTTVEKQSVALRLRNLAADKSENQEAIVQAGAITPLVQLLEDTDPNMREEAARALWNLVRTNREINGYNQVAIAQAGAIAPLIRLLEDSMPRVRVVAAAVLNDLAIDCATNQITIAREGAIWPLIKLLQNDDAPSLVMASGLLQSLATNSADKQVSMALVQSIAPLVELLTAGSVLAQEEAALTLGIFATSSQEIQTAIVRNGAVVPLVERLKGDMMQGTAALALRNLAAGNVENQISIAEAGAIPPLVKLLEDGMPGVQHEAGKALLSLAKDHLDNQLLIMDAEGVVPLADLFKANTAGSASWPQQWSSMQGAGTASGVP